MGEKFSGKVLPSFPPPVQSEPTRQPKQDAASSLQRRKRKIGEDDDEEAEADLIAQADIPLDETLQGDTSASNQAADAAASSTSTGIIAASSSQAAASGGLGVLGWVGIGAGVAGLGGLAVALGGEEEESGGGGGGGGGNGGLDSNLGSGSVTGGGSNISTTGSTPTAGISNLLAFGVVADGYIVGAEIWIDANNNGIKDDGDINTGIVTTEDALFQLYAYDGNGNLMDYVELTDDGKVQLKGPILAIGGVNKDTGVPNTLVLKTPVPPPQEAGADKAGAPEVINAAINPLTTLVQEIVASGKSVVEAERIVQETLGIDGDINLLKYDPISSNDLAAQKAAATVASVAALAGDKAVDVLAALANTLTSNAGKAPISLADAAVLESVLGSAGVTDNSIINAAKDAANDIKNAQDITAISNVQGEVLVNLDNIAPSAPVSAKLSPASDTGVADGRYTTDTTPSLRIGLDTTTMKSAVAGDILRVAASGGGFATEVTITASHIAQGYVDVQLGTLATEGDYVYRARLTDKAGNAGEWLEGIVVTVDNTPPENLAVNEVTGNNFVNASEKAAGVTISGMAEGEAGGRVTVNWAGIQKTATVQSDGSWSVRYTSSQIPEDGNTSVIVKVTDRAGNETNPVEIPVIVDTEMPVQPIGASLTEGTDTGEPDGRYTTETNPVLRIELNTNSRYGVAEGDVLRIETADGQFVDEFPLSSLNIEDGFVDIPLGTLTEGDHGYRARITDQAGNAGEWSELYTVTIDTTPPANPVLGVVAGDDVVNAVEKAQGVTISGTASGEAGSTVTVNWGGVLKTATVQENDTWSVVYAGAELPPDGSSSVTASITDQAGNAGPQMQIPVTIDTAPPAPPTVTITDTGSNSSDGITSNGIISVSGLEEGAQWEYSTDGGASWMVGDDADESGTGMFMVEGSGTRMIVVRQKDVAGTPA